MSGQTDPMRREHRELTPTERAAIDALKNQGGRFLETCDTLGSSREISIAKTKMEEAVMWAVKHVTR